MEEEEQKICPNCKREIPASNFTIHTVHCARNIRVCPVCKEPVPQAELEEHHEKLHKLLPCKQCGELVCGTDLEDHIRDSCGHTIKSCRYCELELPRRELPAHENYCGVRTEQCPDCHEWVMIKYRQLHLDSNHGFLRLDDDPVPKKDPPKKELLRPRLLNLPKATNLPKPTNVPAASTSNDIARPAANLKNINLVSDRPRTTEIRYYGATNNDGNSSNAGSHPMRFNQHHASEPKTVIRYYGGTDNGFANNGAGNSGINNENTVNAFDIRPSTPRASPGLCPRFNSSSRFNSVIRYFGITNNDSSSSSSSSSENLATTSSRPAHINIPSSSRAANINNPRLENSNNSRPANINNSGPANINSSKPMNLNVNPSNAHSVYNGFGASSGSRMPIKRTNDQPQINTAVAAENKIHKDLPSSRGAVKKRPAPKPPRSAPADPKRDLAYHSALLRSQQEEQRRQEQNAYNLAHGLPPVLSAAAKLDKLRKMDALHNREAESQDYKTRLQGRVWQDRGPDVDVGHVLGSEGGAPAPPAARRADNGDPRDQFRDVKPMTQEEFMDRFRDLQVRREAPASGADRFSEIKSSLRELRRGLNEVTAPYNNVNANFVNNGERGRRPSPPPSPRGSPSPPGPRSRPPSPAPELTRLPCEFCDRPIPVDDLVQHQTGCRPDLAQLRPRCPRAPRPPPPRPPAPPADPYEEPVIPCEFCTESLPVYLISEHQERCGRERNLLYAD